MRTLRLLVWLRWRLWFRGASLGARASGLAFTALLLLALSPLWVGGAIAAYAGVRALGAPVVVVAFGACQLVWLWLGLLSGALGRAFDLDKLLRYPLRPRTVFALNLVLSVFEPVGLMTLPTLVAVAAGAGARAGAPAAVGAAAGGVLLVLLTAAIVQVLLVLLDDLLRREWVRYAATFGVTLGVVLLQVSLRHLVQVAFERWLHQQVTGEQALAVVARALRFVPTVSAPAAVANAALGGGGWLGLAGGVAALALLACAVVPGGALMRFTVRAGENTSRAGAGRGDRGGHGLAAGAGLLPPGVALQLGRELRYSLRHPQRLMNVLPAPLIVVFFYGIERQARHAASSAVFTAVMLTSSVASASMMQFAWDGPGVRSFFLLPCRPRDVLLAKNLELMLRTALQLALVLAALALLARGIWTPLLGAALVATAGVVGGVLAIGTALSISDPARVRRRGLATRGQGGLAGTLTYLGMIALTGVAAGVLWLARTLAGPAWADAASLLAASLLAAAGIAVWWRSLDLNAGRMLACRERLVEALAKTDND